MYIGNGKTNEKEKERIFLFAEKNTMKGLQRSYDYHTSLFTAMLVALILFSFDFIKELAVSSLSFSQFVLNGTILIAIGLLLLAVANSRDESFFALKIREGKLINSKKKAFELIDNYSLKVE